MYKVIKAKKLIIGFFFIVFTILLLPKNFNSAIKTSADIDNNKVISVIIDAGHGGFDGGAVANDNTNEKDINLEIAKSLKDLFNIMGIDVIMIRDTDKSLADDENAPIRQKKVSDMNNRLKIIKENPNVILISIHQNKFPQSYVNGAQVFYNYKSEESAKLAKSIQNNLKALIDNENNRVEKSSAEEYFLLHYSDNIGIIVECGFLSNEEELNKLKSQEYQKKLALAIYKGLMDYLNL